MGLLDAPTRLPVPNLIRPSGLRRWRKFRAEAIYDRQVISCYGDSHTEGRYADTATTIPITTDAAQELWRDQGWVAVLRKAFQTQYGDCGEGYIVVQPPVAEFEPRIVFGGSGFNFSGVGAIGGVSFSGVAQTMTLTTPVCNQIEIFDWWRNDVSGQWSYVLNGAAPVTVPAKNSSSGIFTRTLLNVSLGVHTLVITGPSSGRADIGGFGCYKATTGIQVNRLGRGGALAGTVLGTAPSGTVLLANFEQPRTKLAIFMFGSNDYINQPGFGTGLGASPTSVKSTLQASITYQTVTNGGCVLIVPGPYVAEPATPRPWTQQAYTDAMRSLALENDHVSFVDLNRVHGTLEQATADGLRADFIHPNRAGHGDIGQQIHSILTRADLGVAV